jgi:hypothetical protein
MSNKPGPKKTAHPKAPSGNVPQQKNNSTKGIQPKRLKPNPKTK